MGTFLFIKVALSIWPVLPKKIVPSNVTSGVLATFVRRYINCINWFREDSKKKADKSGYGPDSSCVSIIRTV